MKRCRNWQSEYITLPVHRIPLIEWRYPHTFWITLLLLNYICFACSKLLAVFSILFKSVNSFKLLQYIRTILFGEDDLTRLIIFNKSYQIYVYIFTEFFFHLNRTLRIFLKLLMRMKNKYRIYNLSMGVSRCD